MEPEILDVLNEIFFFLMIVIVMRGHCSTNGDGELLPVPVAAAHVRDVGHTRAFRDVRRG